MIAELPRAPSAPAGGAPYPWKLVNSSRQENLVVARVRTYARIRPGDEFIFVLDLESFLRKSNTKTFFGLLRVNLNVIETCKNTVLLERFFFLMFSHDLDISFQLK